jgi:hypothetical protein
MKVIVLFLEFMAATTFGQLSKTIVAENATVLRNGEIIRCYKRGGLTPKGQYQVLIAITGKAIYIKTHERADTVRVTEGIWDAILSALRTIDEEDLFSRKRPYTVPHSASDGTDIYISFRKGGKLFHWDNVRFDPPEKGFRLLQFLDNIEHGRAP